MRPASIESGSSSRSATPTSRRRATAAPSRRGSLFDRLFVQSTLWLLWLVRRFISLDSRAYLLLSAGPLQPLLARIGLMRARAVFLKAKDRCPAYRDFLASSGYSERGRWRLSDLPVTTKENNVKRY